MLHPVESLLEGTTDLDGYLKKLRAYARTRRSLSTPADQPDDDQLKTIGDGFELFGEFFIRSMGAIDNRILVDNYRLLNISDNGVDAEAEDPRDGREIFIQYKCYRETEILSGHRSHLDSFVAEVGMIMRERYPDGVLAKGWPRMLVVTSAQGMARYTQETKYRGTVECYPIKDLRELTASPAFWKQFRSCV